MAFASAPAPPYLLPVQTEVRSDGASRSIGVRRRAFYVIVPPTRFCQANQVLNMISLRKALENGKLENFIRQEEHRLESVPTADEFDDAVGRIVTPRQSEDRTSHSASRGYSREK